MSTKKLKLRLVEIKKMINKSTSKLEITNLIFEKNKLENELFKKFIQKKNFCF